MSKSAKVVLGNIRFSDFSKPQLATAILVKPFCRKGCLGRSYRRISLPPGTVDNRSGQPILYDLTPDAL
jgi:hypothetical protein